VTDKFYRHIQDQLVRLDQEGLRKTERIITTPQGPTIRTQVGGEVINLCANNYLGLSSHATVIQGACSTALSHGHGLSSVRFICGTQDIHKALEAQLSAFVGTEDTILYAAAFDANGGLFEPLLGPEDAIISDELNHASVIDGIRLCKAKRYVYRHSDLADLEHQLQKAEHHAVRFKLVFTDGVFSMDGTIAQLHQIRELCDRYGALLGVDDSHATGIVGPTGRGTHEHRGVFGKVDILTGTLGKALGGASGGFTSGRREMIELLRQRSRPYMFSNSLPPSVVGGALAALNLLGSSSALRAQLTANTRYFRQAITAAGFEIKPGEHPIVPIMVYEAPVAQKLAARLLELGVYVIGFFYPVVPHGSARVRVQISAAHQRQHIETAVAAFSQAGRELGLIS
jgi:glycine C-acetyltransferase